MPIAIARQVSPRFNECEITHIERTPIDIDVARAQHEQYVRALKRLGCGCDLVELPAEPDLPDSVFVEDTAFILPEAAVITRSGADSRKPETASIIPLLAPLKKLLYEAARFGPRTDVLQTGLLALSLVMGRLIRRDEFPRQIGELLLGATETGPSGRQPLGLGLRAWLVRALQLGSQDSYATVGQALKGLEQILTGADGYVADSAAVFAMLAPAAPEARPSPAPAPAPAPARAAGSGPHAPAMPAKDSGPRVAAEFPQPAVAADRHPVAVRPALREVGQARQGQPGASSLIQSMHCNSSCTSAGAGFHTPT